MKPLFMSADHVSAMNRALTDSREVTDACRELGRNALVHYRLAGGPDGDAIHWTTEVSPSGLSFGLGCPEAADIVIEADYVEMVRAARAARDGRPEAGGAAPVITGDSELLVAVGSVLALARSVATIDVEFPDV